MKQSAKKLCSLLVVLCLLVGLVPFGAFATESSDSAEGFVGLEALAEDKLGAGVDQRTVMILSQEGELLILSGYSLEGDEEAAQSLLEQVLRGITVNGQSIYLTKE